LVWKKWAQVVTIWGNKKTLINLDTYKGHISMKNMDQICARFWF
jgi:hypothetical protein